MDHGDQRSDIPELVQEPSEVVFQASTGNINNWLKLQASMFWRGRSRLQLGMRLYFRQFFSSSSVPECLTIALEPKMAHSGTAARTFGSSASSLTLSTGSTTEGFDVPELGKVQSTFRLRRLWGLGQEIELPNVLGAVQLPERWTCSHHRVRESNQSNWSTLHNLPT
jgi:hypothetical protein